MIGIIRPIAILLTLAVLAGSSRADQTSLPNGEIKIGAVTLRPCNYPKGALCGRLDQPLDSAGETPGAIAIRFEWYAHRNADEPARGTIVAVSGGPGGATSNDRNHYLNLFDALLDDWNLLLADNRGTGKSDAIKCDGLQSSEGWTTENGLSCAWHLGDASDLYGTADAVDDLAAIVNALGLPAIDLYGSSYGGYFGQVFAARHGELLRSLVLDGPLTVLGDSPVETSMMAAVRRSLDTVCRRTPGCAALDEWPVDRLGKLVARVRSEPISAGFYYPTDDQWMSFQIGPDELMHLVQTNYMGPVALRETDAAVRAYLDDRDFRPISRLVGESYAVLDPATESADEFSEGLFLAVQCQDYRLPFSISGSVAERRQKLDAALSDLNDREPDIYAPFSVQEYWRDGDGKPSHPCLSWPPPSASHPQGPPLAPGTAYPDVPVLILSAEFDSVAPAEEAAAIARSFPNARHVVFANSLHVVAGNDMDDCAGGIVRHFILELDPGPLDCARDIPAIRTVPSFSQLLRDVTPASDGGGNAAEQLDLQLAAMAALTVGDVMYRWYTDWDGSGTGLRGGTWRYREDSSGVSYDLDKVQWTVDSNVTGTAHRAPDGAVTASVQVRGPGATESQFELSWQENRPDRPAQITGTVAGHRIRATMPPP